MGLEVTLYEMMAASKPCSASGEKTWRRKAVKGHFSAMEAERENSHTSWTERGLENRTGSSQ